MNMTSCGVVAVGDSVSEGVGDPWRDGLRGWVHYLAEECPELHLVANLARSGATVSRLRRSQVEPAVTLAPSLVTCTIGVNDVLSRRFDVRAFQRDYEYVVETLSDVARTGVLTMSLHDFAAALPLTGAKRAELRARTAAANEVIEAVSRRHDAWMLDARVAERLERSGMLSIDRLHPNRRGHRYIAAFARTMLYAKGVTAEAGAVAVPAADPWDRRVQAGFRHGVWLGRHLVAPLATRTRRSLAQGRSDSAAGHAGTG